MLLAGHMRDGVESRNTVEGRVGELDFRDVGLDEFGIGNISAHELDLSC